MIRDLYSQGCIRALSVVSAVGPSAAMALSPVMLLLYLQYYRYSIVRRVHHLLHTLLDL